LTRFYVAADAEAGKPYKEVETASQIGRSEDESWRVRKDGALLWINEVMTPLHGHDGVLLGYTKVSRDLTARKRAEEAARKSDERLRLVVDSIKD
jgi:PAS domain S-box-containing protein